MQELHAFCSSRDVEEFSAKLQQIAGFNVKGIVAAKTSFQSGARNFARSKGIAYLRYFDKSNFKWELRRSPSAGADSTSAFQTSQIETGLSMDGYQSHVFDLYGDSILRLTNSLWDFFEDLICSSEAERTDAKRISNPRNRLASKVAYLEQNEIESCATGVLEEIGHVAGQVSLQAICVIEQEKSGLSVVEVDCTAKTSNGNAVLGTISFSPPTIKLYKWASPTPGRERFTLAHELGHHFLAHGKYMIRESCDEDDFFGEDTQTVEAGDIRRMEWQANHFATCLLMPRGVFSDDFRAQAGALNLTNKGFGALYLDNQGCNLKSYYLISNHLTNKYQVSRAAATYRLSALGLLKDERNVSLTRHMRNVFGQLTRDDEVAPISSE